MLNLFLRFNEYKLISAYKRYARKKKSNQLKKVCFYPEVDNRNKFYNPLINSFFRSVILRNFQKLIYYQWINVLVAVLV